MALEYIPELEDGKYTADTYMVLLSILRRLMATTKTHTATMQEIHEGEFDQKVRTPRNRVSIGSRVFVRKDYHPTDEPRHKFASLATGPHPVTELNGKTCIILRDNKITELITLDFVVLALEVGTDDSMNTKDTQWSQECLQRMQKIHTNKLIVPQDDTNDTRG